MRRVLVLFAVIALLACPAIVAAQAGEMQAPPKILEIVRENSKPGKAIAHRKHEAAWTQAFAKAGYPHMLTISSVTGPDEDWFMTGFETFAQMEKVNESLDTNPALQQAMTTFSPKEADFVSESRMAIARYHPEMSYKTDFKLGEFKYFNVLIAHYKLGSSPEEVHKVVQAAREKANPDYHQLAYEVTSGMSPGTYIYFTPVKTLAAWDEPPNKAYGEALKEGGFSEAVGKTVQSVDSRLFAFNPKLSDVPESVAKANPEFWHPKAEMAKALSKKAATPAAKKENKTENK